MNKKKRLIIRVSVLAIIVIALGGTLYTGFLQDNSPAAAGNTAPAFALTDVDGNEVQLSDFEGQGVLLTFWQTYCSSCRWEMPHLEEEYEALREQGIEVLAVNIGEQRVSVSRFRDELDLSYPLLLDRDMKMMRSYGVNRIPVNFFIDANGEIVEKVEAPLSVEQIREYAKQIQIG